MSCQLWLRPMFIRVRHVLTERSKPRKPILNCFCFTTQTYAFSSSLVTRCCGWYRHDLSWATRHVSFFGSPHLARTNCKVFLSCTASGTSCFHDKDPPHSWRPSFRRMHRNCIDCNAGRPMSFRVHFFYPGKPEFINVTQTAHLHLCSANLV